MVDWAGTDDDRFDALASNVDAICAVAQAVAGTLGPGGRDVMLIGPNGETTVTADGVTVVTQMEAAHPAARMAVNAARAQERAVGDGTTTAVVLAAALLAEARDQVRRGLGALRLAAGIQWAAGIAGSTLADLARPVVGYQDPLLEQVARVAARGHDDVARAVLAAAAIQGPAGMGRAGFRLADTVVTEIGVATRAVPGVVVNRRCSDWQQPAQIQWARVLVLDDALAAGAGHGEGVAPGPPATAAALRYLEQQRLAFLAGVRRLAEAGVGLVALDGSADPEALLTLTEAGVMVLERVPMAEWQRLARHTGARVVRRSILGRAAPAIRRCLGRARQVQEDSLLGCVWVAGGPVNEATVWVGAATEETVQERHRIACDAAGAVQAALNAGVVPGGGAAELAAARAVAAAAAAPAAGSQRFGARCVEEALRRLAGRIAANAGWSPLDAVQAVQAAQIDGGADVGLDCHTGVPANMLTAGVVDPLLVKAHALRVAAEVAVAVLRIDTIVRQRPAAGAGGSSVGGGSALT